MCIRDSNSIISPNNLATVAKEKKKILNNNTQVSKNTSELIAEEGVKSNPNRIVPNLVTKKIDNAVESSNKVENSADKAKQTTKNAKPQAAEQRVKQTHNSVSFKDGIIVHDEAEKGISNEAKIADNTSDSQTENETPTYSKNRLQSKKT